MTAGQDKAKARLKRLAHDLKTLSDESTTLNVRDVNWLADAIKSFLDGDFKSMDKALGLINSVGKPVGVKHKLICEVWAASTENLTAEKIAALTQDKYPEVFKDGIEAKEVRRAIGTLSKDPKKFLRSQHDGGWTETASAAVANETATRMNRPKKVHK